MASSALAAACSVFRPLNSIRFGGNKNKCAKICANPEWCVSSHYCHTNRVAHQHRRRTEPAVLCSMELLNFRMNSVTNSDDIRVHLNGLKTKAIFWCTLHTHRHCLCGHSMFSVHEHKQKTEYKCLALSLCHVTSHVTGKQKRFFDTFSMLRMDSFHRDIATSAAARPVVLYLLLISLE